MNRFKTKIANKSQNVTHKFPIFQWLWGQTRDGTVVCQNIVQGTCNFPFCEKCTGCRKISACVMERHVNVIPSESHLKLLRSFVDFWCPERKLVTLTDTLIKLHTTILDRKKVYCPRLCKKFKIMIETFSRSALYFTIVFFKKIFMPKFKIIK